MKKKILSIAMIITLLMTMLVTLTACGEDSGKSKKDSDAPSAKELIKSYAKNLNKADAKALAKQVDVKKLNKILDEDYEKEDVQDAYESFLELYEDADDWYELVDTTKVKDIDDLEDADIYADEDVLEECIDKYEVYLLDIEVDGDEENDFVVINDGKIVYNMILGYTLGNTYDYDDDDYDYDYDYDEGPNDSEFNVQFEGYEGTSVSGTKVKELLDTAIESNEESSDIVWIYYYGEDEDDYTEYNYTKDDIEDVKDKIESTHKYKVEYEYDYSGYVDDIKITY